jgi:hypothetical protein
LAQLWAIAALAGIFVVLQLTLVRPHDFWWHARAGQWIVENGHVPDTDFFSFTRAGEPYAFGMWWLMEVVLYLLLRAGGLPLVIFAHAVVITIAYGLLFVVSRRAAGGDLRWAAVTTFAAAAVGFDNWNVRPQTISILFFALTLYLVERDREPGSARALWWLLPVFALWANSHGGYVLGLALLGTHLFACLLAWLRGQRPFPTHATLVTLLSTAAVLLVPLVLGLGAHGLTIFQHPVVRQLTVEWMPPTIQTRSGALFFGLAIALVALLLVSRYRPTPGEGLRLLLFGVLALMARRNTIWFAFVAAPTMAASLRCWLGTRGPAEEATARRRPINLGIALMAGLLALLSLPWFRPYLSLPEERRAYVSAETPVEAVAYLSSLSPGRVFHSDAFGSYMIWAVREVPVFIDTRIAHYPPAQWQDYLALSQARYDWQAILERYEVDTLLLEREKQEPLIEAATAAPGWERLYEDEQAVLFQQRGGP